MHITLIVLWTWRVLHLVCYPFIISKRKVHILVLSDHERLASRGTIKQEAKKHHAPMSALPPTQTLHLRHQFQYHVRWVSPPPVCAYFLSPLPLQPLKAMLCNQLLVLHKLMIIVFKILHLHQYIHQPPVSSVQGVSSTEKKERPWQNNTTALKSGSLNCKKNSSCCKLVR